MKLKIRASRRWSLDALLNIRDMKRQIVFLSFMMSFPILVFSQDYWTKTYDPFEHEKDDIRNILIEDSIIYASCRGSCLKDSVVECAKMVKFNRTGNILDGFENPLFESGYGLETDENWLYVDGGNEPFNNQLFISRVSKDFTSSERINQTVDSSFSLVNRSSVSTHDHFVLYGSYRDSTVIHDNGKHQVNGVQIWVNKATFEVDTIVHFLPTRWFRVIHSMIYDGQGYIYSIGGDSQLNNLGIERSYLKITKQNMEGDVVHEFTYPVDLESKSNYYSSLTMVGDNLVFRAGLDHEYNNDPSIVCVDTLGNKLWEHEYKERIWRGMKPHKVLTGIDNRVFVLGLTEIIRFGWADVAFITCLNGITGELLWERVYEVDKGQDPIFTGYAKFARLFDLEQTDNGDIYAAGYVDNIYDDPDLGLRHDKDLWLMKFDSMGCLTPNCGYVQSIQNGVVIPDTCKWLEDGAEWFYTPWSIDFQERLAKIEIIGDTLIGNRLCSILGLFEEDEYVEDSDLIVFYERENEKVYFNEDDTFKLMYDFSPSVLPGDTVEYYLPQKLQYYDISSSGGDFLPSDQPYKYRNIGQDWVTLSNGEQLRIVNTQSIPNENGDCFAMGRIIDGIGSDSGLLSKSCNQLPSGREEFFRCFKSNSVEYTEVDGACTITPTREIIADNQVSVFPNPASNEIHIETDVEFQELKIYAITGKCIRKGVYNSTIRIGSLLNGVYILELIGFDGIYKTKIIKGG